ILDNFFFSSRRRHTRSKRDWSSDVCSSDLDHLFACGLPVIAFEGPETAAPITEAGLAFFSPQRKGDLGDVLLRVLEDEHYRTSLAQRSFAAQRQYFSWRVIAARYAEFLRRQP